MQKVTFKTIDEYIALFPKNVQSLLTELRKTIKNCAPNAIEAISYQMPTFKLNGNLIHFAAYASHIGLYPAPSGVTAFQTELTPYKTSKGAIQFPINQPLPLDLIKRIVEFRIAEMAAKSNSDKKNTT